MAAVDRQSLPVFPGEESPDCTEQEVLFSAKACQGVKEGYCGLYAAGRKVQQKKNRRFPVRVKRWGKSPPGTQREQRRTGKPLPQQDQIGNELLLAALQVPGSGRIDR